MSLPNLTNVNDRSNIPTGVMPRASEHPAPDGSPAEGQQGGAVMTQARAMQPAAAQSAPTQPLANHTEPMLAIADTEPDIEKICEGRLDLAQPGVLIHGFANLLDKAFKQKSMRALAMLMDHLNDVASKNTSSHHRGIDGALRTIVVSYAIQGQWLDGMKLVLARGASFSVDMAMQDQSANGLLKSEPLLNYLLSSVGVTDRQILLNRMLEVSLAFGKSDMEVSPASLSAMGADVLSKPSAFVLLRWHFDHESVQQWCTHFKSRGYVRSFQSAMNDIDDHELTAIFLTALSRPVPPGNLLEYACQQGQLAVVESVLNNMKPASAAQIAKWLMCHVISEKDIPKKYAEFVQLLLGKALSFDHTEGQAILDEWLLVSAMYRNADAWRALIDAGAKSGCLKTFHPAAVIDTLIQHDLWSDLGFFLIQQGGDWDDGPNDGEPRGEKVRQDVKKAYEQPLDIYLLDVLSCADLLRHQQITRIDTPAPKLAFAGTPWHQIDKRQGLNNLRSFIPDCLWGTSLNPDWDPDRAARYWEDTGLPHAVLSELQRLLRCLDSWKTLLALDHDDGVQRREYATLWFLATLHENLEFRYLYKDFEKIPESALPLMRAFAFQSACDTADLAQAKLKDVALQWKQLPVLATRYAGPDGLDMARLEKRLRKVGFFAPNAERVAHALELAHQRASGQQATTSTQATISEQLSQAKEAVARAIARELPACLAAVSREWSAESGATMPAFMRGYLDIAAPEGTKFKPDAATSSGLNSTIGFAGMMLLDLVTSQFDLLLDVFRVRNPVAIQRRTEAIHWRKQAVNDVYQYWLDPETLIEDSEDSDDSNATELGSDDDELSASVANSSDADEAEAELVDDDIEQ